MTTMAVHPGTQTAEIGVAELQGLYGPFSFPEKLLQKIWWRGDFTRHACRTTDGQVLEILYPGKWNLLGGPDFKSARLRLGGNELTGDVELHLHARDWSAHRHASDPAYAKVVLHVVLFPPEAGYVTAGCDEKIVPLLVLLPLLHHDLEEYAADEAVETLANRPLARAVQELGAVDDAELAGLIERFALRRWRSKIHFARLRVERLGWEAACHQTALEILGYRFNRAAMLRVAARLPLSDWRQEEVCADAAYEGEAGRWSLQGVRPANHPYVRLRQYSRWATERPDWPRRLAAEAERLPEGEIAAERTAEFRRVHVLTALRETLRLQICDGRMGGLRFDNLVCDGFLPLVAARSNRALGAAWFHWFPGDLPREVWRTLRLLGVIGIHSRPGCHGAGQGLLGWLIERENCVATAAPARTGRGA